MASLNKGKTFTSGETVEPADMHQLVDNGTVTFSTVSDTDNATLEVSGNKFRVKDGGVTAAKLADGSVASAKLADSSVTAAKLATGAVETAKIANDAVTDDKLSLAANAGEVKKALNADNAPPIFACRAWVNFDGETAADLSGTYSRDLTDVTVVATAHGLIVGNVVRLDFTTGGALDGTYTVTQVDDADTFHITTVASGTIVTGSVTLLRRLVRASGNVSSVTYLNSVGQYVVNMAVAMPDANGCVLTTCGNTSAEVAMYVAEQTATAVTVVNAINAAYGANNMPLGYVAIFR